MRNEPIDFIGVDYAIDSRDAEDMILPLAAERRIGVLVYLPFGRTRLWNRVAGQQVPGWAAEFDATTWAQFFLKFVAAHPAVTAITPSTSQARNMADNLGAATGRLPDEATRRRMVEVVDALPPAQRGALSPVAIRVSELRPEHARALPDAALTAWGASGDGGSAGRPLDSYV